MATRPFQFAGMEEKHTPKSELLHNAGGILTQSRLWQTMGVTEVLKDARFGRALMLGSRLERPRQQHSPNNSRGYDQ